VYEIKCTAINDYVQWHLSPHHDTKFTVRWWQY